MAGTSLLALIDDIASVLDDVSILTKVAAKKTAGVLGDDLALNAEQVTGVETARELPVVWAVAKGSFVNKLILVPAALAISAFAPWGVTPLLMVGGAFLCFEGVEKVAHKLLHPKAEARAEHAAHLAALADPKVDLVAFEKTKIKGAIRTDFILSAEIVAITLGAVATEPLGIRVAVLSAIALLMTVGVYGLVAGIVKLDDLGLHLERRGSRRLGGAILTGAVWLMKALSVAGTAAMLLVGGGILTHGILRLHHFIESHGHDGAVGWLLSTLADLAVGLLAGAVAVGLVQVASRARAALRGKRSDVSAH